MQIVAVAAAGIAWFIVAAICFFNPIVDKLYRAEEGHPAVRTLPKSPATIGKILGAIAVQVVLWAIVFHVVKPALPVGKLESGLVFAAIIGAMKIVPRDVDRVLLTTYPGRRMAIELVIGLICALPVGLAFAYLSG